MVYQYPEYHPITDRLDFLADTARTSVASVVLVNDEWNGSEYIEDAVLPTSGLDYTPDLTAGAQALRDRLFTISNPSAYISQLPFAPAAQMHRDLSRLAMLDEAAWWSALVRLLMPANAVVGQPGLGSDWLLGALMETQAGLDRILRYAEQLLGRDEVWYGVLELDPDLRAPLRLRLLTELELRSE